MQYTLRTLNDDSIPTGDCSQVSGAICNLGIAQSEHQGLLSVVRATVVMGIIYTAREQGTGQYEEALHCSFPLEWDWLFFSAWVLGW